MRKIKARSGRKTMPGWFPTHKGVDGQIRTETTLEMAGLGQYEVNPDCVLMAGQPHHLIYWEPQGNGRPIRRRYTPDVAILMRDGTIAVVDFKIAKFARSEPWQRKARLLKHAYRFDHGVVFNTVTDEEIEIEPRRSNVARMLASRPIVRDETAAAILASAIMKLGLPATIGEICARVHLPCDRPEVDRAFSWLMEMAITGEIALDLGRPLGNDTVVRPCVRIRKVGADAA